MVRLAWTSCLIAATLCLRAATATAAPFAFVANHGDGTLAIIDTATNTVATTVPVGNFPRGVAVAPDGARVYVTNQVSLGTLQVLDGAGVPLTTVPVGDNPTGVAVKLPGTRVYVANRDDDSVSVIDTATNTVVATVAVGAGPFGVAVNPTGSPVYVVNKGDDTLSVIDTTTNTVIATVPTGPPGGAPTHVAVSPTGSRVYVTNYVAATLTVLEIPTYGVVATIPVGLYPQGLAVNATGTRVYVANQGPETVSVIDAVNDLVVATVPVGKNPEDLMVDPSGSRVYVANRSGASVSVIDTASNTEIDIDAGVANGLTRITVGQGPVGLGGFIVPGLGAPAMSRKALACQMALAGRAQAFAVADQTQQAGCHNRLLKDVAEGKGTQQAEASCALALDLNNPASKLARARAAATRKVVKTCGDLTPASIGAPCDRGAATFGATADCVLDQHLAEVSVILAATFAAGDPPVLSKDARACQAALAQRTRGFGVALLRGFSACINRLLKAASAGKDPAKARAACLKLLDPDDPEAKLSVARAGAVAKIVKKCGTVAPLDIGSPCDGSDTTMAEVAACVLDVHATRAQKMIAAEYNVVCPVLNGLGLGRAYPSVCAGP